MYCYKCGKKILKDSNFCIYCGTTSNSKQESVTQESILEELNVEESIIEETAFLPESLDEPSLKVNKKKKIPFFIYILIMLALLCIPLFGNVIFTPSSKFYDNLIAGIGELIQFQELEFSIEIEGSDYEDDETIQGSIYWDPSTEKVLAEYTDDLESRNQNFYLYENELYKFNEDNYLYDTQSLDDLINDFWSIYYNSINYFKDPDYTEFKKAYESIFTVGFGDEVAEKFFTFTDLNEFEKCYNNFISKWNDSTYLQDTFDSFEETIDSKRTTYTLTANLSELLQEIVSEFSSSNQIFSLLKKDIKNTREYEDITMKVEFNLENDILTKITFTFYSIEGESLPTITFNFFNFNNTSLNENQILNKILVEEY